MSPENERPDLPDHLTLDHPLTGASYVIREAGRITVTLQGRSGTYDGVGRWIDGDFLPVDPQMCRWLDSGWLTRGAAVNRRYTSGAIAPETTSHPEST